MTSENTGACGCSTNPVLEAALAAGALVASGLNEETKPSGGCGCGGHGRKAHEGSRGGCGCGGHGRTARGGGQCECDNSREFSPDLSEGRADLGLKGI